MYIFGSLESVRVPLQTAKKFCSTLNCQLLYAIKNARSPLVNTISVASHFMHALQNSSRLVSTAFRGTPCIY